MSLRSYGSHAGGRTGPPKPRELLSMVRNNIAMRPEDFDKGLTLEPFVPLRLHLSNVRSIDILNPGLVWIVSLSLFVARTDWPNSRLAEDYDIILLRHIVRFEILEPSPPPEQPIDPPIRNLAERREQVKGRGAMRISPAYRTIGFKKLGRRSDMVVQDTSLSRDRRSHDSWGLQIHVRAFPSML